MTIYYSGQLVGNSKQHFAIICARFNDFIGKELLAGAQDSFERHGVPSDNISVFWVPGAFELPVVASRLARSGKYDAIVALGVVIRGATAHFDHVAGQTAGGLQSVAVQTGVPVIFGVLTTDSIEQAIERAGTKAGNKGAEAAVTALEMANLLTQLSF